MKYRLYYHQFYGTTFKDFDSFEEAIQFIKENSYGKYVNDNEPYIRQDISPTKLTKIEEETICEKNCDIFSEAIEYSKSYWKAKIQPELDKIKKRDEDDERQLFEQLKRKFENKD